jgi:endonuclease III
MRHLRSAVKVEESINLKDVIFRQQEVKVEEGSKDSTVKGECIKELPTTPIKKEPESQITPVKKRVSPLKVSSTPRKRQRTPRKPAKHWQEVLEGIKAFRANNPAPVDTVGCERLATSTIPQVYRYEILTSLQLSSQTKDPVTAQAIKNLQMSPNGLTIDSIIEMSESTLDGFISKVGFHNRKSIYIKQTAQILKDKYNSDIPDSLEGLLELPGIGPKMAHLCLQYSHLTPDVHGVKL